MLYYPQTSKNKKKIAIDINLDPCIKELSISLKRNKQKMFGNPDIGFHHGREFTSTSMVPVITHVPMWKEKGRIEQGLFESTDELSKRVTDDFLIQMARQTREEREKQEAEIRKQDEERKMNFLRTKWQKIIMSLDKNYKGIDVSSEDIDPRISAEIKRCMTIPSGFLRTKLVSECDQCSKGIFRGQKQYKPFRHHSDEKLDFDGHFPEDHVQLFDFEEYSKEEKEEQQRRREKIYGVLPPHHWLRFD